MCMKFYDDTKPLYLETDASGIGLGATLLQQNRMLQHARETQSLTTPFYVQ